MVRRLVEDEGRRFREQHPRKFDTASLPARKGPERLPKNALRKSKARGDRCRFGLGLPAAEQVEAIFEARVTPHRIFLAVRISGGHRVARDLELSNDAVKPSCAEDAIDGLLL